MTHVHLIGIGGSGLSAIARVLLERGDTVSGSDRELSTLAKDVQAAGARVYFGHRSANIAGADLVVRSSAIPENNVEVKAAVAEGIPVLKRSEFLGQLMVGHRVIAVAGTHGKTTTTSMLAWMLTSLDQDPTYIIGGVSANLETNAHAGQGTVFIIEADEYDRMFLGLEPAIAVVTNVEYDHPDCFPTQQDFYQAFQQFVSRIIPNGTLLACVDDTQTRHLLSETNYDGISVRSYGISPWLGQTMPEYYAHDLSSEQSGGFAFEAVFPSQGGKGQPRTVRVELRVPGRHNVLNALAALAVVDELGLSLGEAARALGDFRGTSRRFEVRGEVRGVTVIDDYAHHPTEIRATLSAARNRYPGSEIWTVWQPHTYSRTRRLFAEFVSSFNETDHLMITEIYAARESTPRNGFSARKFVDDIAHQDVQFVNDFDQAVDILVDRLGSHDIVLVLSAGDATQISAKVLEVLHGSDLEQ